MSYGWMLIELRLKLKGFKIKLSMHSNRLKESMSYPFSKKLLRKLMIYKSPMINTIKIKKNLRNNNLFFTSIKNI